MSLHKNNSLQRKSIELCIPQMTAVMQSSLINTRPVFCRTFLPVSLKSTFCCALRPCRHFLSICAVSSTSSTTFIDAFNHRTTTEHSRFVAVTKPRWQYYNHSCCWDDQWNSEWRCISLSCLFSLDLFCFFKKCWIGCRLSNYEVYQR